MIYSRYKGRTQTIIYCNVTAFAKHWLCNGDKPNYRLAVIFPLFVDTR